MDDSGALVVAGLDFNGTTGPAKDWESEHLWVMPVVAETYDGVLNDINGQHVRAEDALEAINNASNDRPVPEGNTGGGTGWRNERAPDFQHRSSLIFS